MLGWAGCALTKERRKKMEEDGWVIVEDGCKKPEDGDQVILMVTVADLPFIIPATWRVDEKDKTVTIMGLSVPGAKAIAWRRV